MEQSFLCRVGPRHNYYSETQKWLFDYIFLLKLNLHRPFMGNIMEQSFVFLVVLTLHGQPRLEGRRILETCAQSTIEMASRRWRGGQSDFYADADAPARCSAEPRS